MNDPVRYGVKVLNPRQGCGVPIGDAFREVLAKGFQGGFLLLGEGWWRFGCLRNSLLRLLRFFAGRFEDRQQFLCPDADGDHQPNEQWHANEPPPAV